MKPKHQRLVLLSSVLLGLGLSIGLMLVALQESVVFFYTPSDLLHKTISPQERLRIGGLVEKSSLHQKRGTAHFKITDQKETLEVSYTGALPDLFREEQGVVAEGYLITPTHFQATTVLAKHDETYMPKEVADHLKKTGLWRDAQPLHRHCEEGSNPDEAIAEKVPASGLLHLPWRLAMTMFFYGDSMLGEVGNFFLAMSLGFASVQSLASLWGVYTQKPRYLALGRLSAFLQGGFLSLAFVTLIAAFLLCDFSLLLVYLHDHTALPWYYRLAATWGNHEGSLLLFVLILSGVAVAQACLLKDPLWRARTLTVQGLLILLFVLFLMVSSNPFISLPFSATEGLSLNPLLQDRGLLSHPPLLYIGYVGFSGPFSLAIAALWGREDGPTWARLTRPWALFAWSFLTAGVTLGSWWAYYELGWGGWWFWDPVENASLMPWLAGTALLHTLRTESLYRWSLFLALLTFGLSLLGTFLVRSGLITSVHSFAQDPERGFTILCLLGLIMGTAFLIWGWRAPRLQSTPLPLFSRQGALLVNSLLLSLGLLTVVLGTFYPLLSEFFWGKTVAVGAPYFERTFIPLMIPLFLLLPLGCLYQNKGEPLLPLLIGPLTILLGAITLILYVRFPLSLWSFTGLIMAIWVLGGTVMAYLKERLSLGPTLIHIGVGLSLVGVSVGAGLRTDETGILSPGKSLSLQGIPLTLQSVHEGKRENYLYERAILSYGDKTRLTPEKRLYQPQNSLLTKTAIYTNGFQDIYVILGPYQGNSQWLIRASAIPLAPWIWIGGAFMVLGGMVALLQRVSLGRSILALSLLILSSPSYATSPLEQRAKALYQEVRCPVCLGQSLAESDMEEARFLKTFILEKLTAGDSEEQIREALRQQWGDAILFRPPFESHTFVLWLLPFGGFLLIILGFLWKLRRKPKSTRQI